MVCPRLCFGSRRRGRIGSRRYGLLWDLCGRLDLNERLESGQIGGTSLAVGKLTVFLV